MTSGSDNEIEKKNLLLKGDITIARSSLLDVFSKNAWIKKSNFEGIFNVLGYCSVVACIMMIIGNFLRHGVCFDSTFMTLIKDNWPALAFKYSIIVCYSFM